MALARTVSLEPGCLREIIGEGVRWATRADRETLGTGIDHFDRALEGGLSTGILCELVVSSPSSGGQTVLLHLLEAMRRERRFAALVDGANAFDPQTTPNEWAFERKSGLFASWRTWAERTGEFVGTQKRLTQNLEGRGFESAREPGTGQRGFNGIRLKRADYADDPRAP